MFQLTDKDEPLNRLTRHEALDCIKHEIGLLEAHRHRCEDYILRIRQWSLVAIPALLSFAVTTHKPAIAVFGVLVSIMFCGLEIIVRHDYMERSQSRLELLRDNFNDKTKEWRSVTLYDLENKAGEGQYRRPTVLHSLRNLERISHLNRAMFFLPLLAVCMVMAFMV